MKIQNIKNELYRTKYNIKVRFMKLSLKDVKGLTEDLLQQKT